MKFQAPRGTEDALPTQTQNWQWIEHEFRELTRLYGYREIRTPAFEDTELFVRSSGETSDIVSKQMYDFRDKGDRHISLKPEGTAPAMRAVIEHNLCPPGTVARLSYITQIFRYERPQKGRLRQAHQVGLELVGSPSPAADAEVIEITVNFYRRLGLQGIEVNLNSLGRDECRTRYRAAVLEHARPWLEAQGEETMERAKKNPLRLLDTKDPELKEVMSSVPPILDYLEEDSRCRFDELQQLLRDAGVPFKVDVGIVRGLDYYTETVFEVTSSKLGSQSALCGGGRYDNLSKDLGGPPTPSVGVAMGIERAIIVLEAEGLLRNPNNPDVFVAYAGEGQQQEAFALARELRRNDVATTADLDGKSLRAQLRTADKLEVRFVALIGEDELAKNEVSLRDLKSGEQRGIPRDQIVQTIRESL